MKRMPTFILIALLMLTGCSKGGETDISDNLPQTVQSAETDSEASSDRNSDIEMNQQDIVDITKDCVERMTRIDDFIDRTPDARDENGAPIIREPEEDDWKSWYEVETEYTSIDEIYSELENCFTGDLLESYIDAVEYSFMEENGKIYRLVTDGAVGAIDYYIDTTLEIKEQTADSFTVSFDGFDTGYEQQLFCSAALRLVDNMWKIESFSTHG